MTINLADNNPRDEYTVANGNSQTVFTMTFEIFDNADLNVYEDGTLKTITTHYKISDSNSDANAGHTSGTDGFVHFTSAVTASGADKKILFTRDIALARVTDFPTSGPFDVATLNTELDRFTAQLADQKDQNDRSVSLADDDATVSMTLPLKANRVGKTLAFNASTGAVEAGPSVAGVTTISALSADIAALADIEDGTTATDAISGLAAIKTHVTAVSNIATAVSAVNSNATNINAVNSNSSNIDTCAGKASEITSVAAKASLLTSDFVSDLNTLAVTDVINDINLLATSDIVSDLNTLATTDIVSDLNQLATSDIVSDINLLATSDVITDLNLLGTSDFVSDLNTLATSGNVTAVNNVSDSITNVNTVATNLTGINNFFAQYRTGASDPTTSLDEGDLFYNSTSNNLKYYNGSSWVVATTSVNGTANRNTYTATAGQTTFSATYDVGFVDVYLNGVKLIVSTDFTATNGTSIVLASGASLNDTVDIVGYGVFDVANVNFSINDATDVNTAGLTNGQILAFNSSTSDFEPVDANAGAALLAGSTFTGAVVVNNQLDIEEVHEKVTVITSTTGTLTFDTAVQGVVLGTANQTANRTINFTNVNSTLLIGQSVTCAVMLSQGATAYYLSAYQVDSSSVTPKWQGGTAPSAGNVNSIDAYSFTIIKTADATFTVLASQTQFA